MVTRERNMIVWIRTKGKDKELYFKGQRGG